MALDSDTQNSLFGNLKKSIERTVPKEIQHENMLVKPTLEIKIEKALNVSKKSIEINVAYPTPKWQTFDKVTVLLAAEHKEGLDRVAKKLMKYRSNELKGKDDKERITANTLIRALTQSFLNLEGSMKLETLSSEDDVFKWVKKNLKLLN